MFFLIIAIIILGIIVLSVRRQFKENNLQFVYGQVDLSPKQIAVLHKIGYSNKQILEYDRAFLLREIGAYFKQKKFEQTRDNRLVVCFTGFDNVEISVLEKLANDAGFKIVKTLTKDCNLLVCGMNAGPKKIALADEKGIQKLNGDGFRIFANENKE